MANNPNQYPEKNMDLFTDILHDYGDDIDADRDEYLDFESLYENFWADYNNNEISTDIIDFNDKTKMSTSDVIVVDKPRLSQKLSQLSATCEEQTKISMDILLESKTSTTNKRPSLPPTTPTSETTQTKKIKTTDNIKEIDGNLPKFLSRTKDIFQETMKPLLEQTANSINLEQLRRIALIKFQIAINELDKSLWTIYLQSGTDNIQTAEQPLTNIISNLKLWPSDVKRKIMTSSTNTTVQLNEITDDTCLNYVYKMLRHFRDQNKLYSTQLKEYKQNLNENFTLKLEQTLDQFIEQYGTTLHRIAIDEQISSVKYKYIDRSIELEFQQQNPTKYQMEIFENISRQKWEKEINKLQLSLLKKRFIHQNFPTALQSLNIPEPVDLNTIEDITVRQCLLDRYHKVLQRMKSDMMRVYIATQEAKTEEIGKKFDKTYTEMKENLHSGPTNHKLTKLMTDLLRKRFLNINKHLIDTYHLKLRFFAEAPTIKN